MARKQSKPAINTETPLPPMANLDAIQQRLEIIFPADFPDRGILVGQMASRVIFVFIYGGFIEDQARYLRPSHIYFFTEQQTQKTSYDERLAWLSSATKPGFRPEGDRWYADTSRESIRDDLMRNQLLRLGIMMKLSPTGHSITSSRPINYLSAEFANLFDPGLSDQHFRKEAEAWRTRNLDAGVLQRMALRAQGAQAKTSDIFIEMPDKTRIRLSSGASNLIAKSIIEDFTKRHMHDPVVLWISASDKKSYPQFVEISSSVGLKFDLNAELPDMILADMGNPIKFYMCEIVATDGAITDMRKQELLNIINKSNIPINRVEFLTAFEDREAHAFRKNFSKISLNTLVWFRTEPNLLVILQDHDQTSLSKKV